MAKYKNYGKRILAVLMTVAVVLTASSVDIEALAAALGGLGDKTGYSIPRNGYIGEIVSNTEASNEQVDTVSFRMVQEAGVDYTYNAYIYQNPTDSENPESGVLRKTIEGGTISSVGETGEQKIDIAIGNGSDGKPIVLTPDETLGVAILLNGATAGNIEYCEKSSGKGFRKSTAYESWESRGDIIMVTTSTYAGSPDDVTAVTLSPDKTVFSVGDEDIALNASVTPAYKRDITYMSNNTSAVKMVGSKAHAEGSGEAVITATSGSKSTTAKLYVLSPTLNKDTYPYTGAAIEPDLTVTCGANTLTKGTDYTLSCSNNVNPGTATVTITGMGKYVGYSKTLEYTINKGVITQEMVNNGSYVIDTTSDTLTNATLGSLTYGTDYTATAVRTATTVSSVTYTITVTGRGNYENEGGVPLTTTKTYEAGSTKLDINSIVDPELEEDVYYYTGSEVRPTNIIFYPKGTGAPDPVNFDGKYTVSYSPDITSASEDDPKVVTISGNESAGYTGTVELEYWVLPRSLEDSGISVTVQKAADGSDNWEHTGSAIEPSVTITFDPGSGARTLVKDTDYTVLYSNNRNVGTANIRITGKGNYADTIDKTFTIIPDFEKDAEISVGGYKATYSNNFVTAYTTPYTGNAQTPTVRYVKVANKRLTENIDYTVSHNNNTNAGKGEIIITGLGIYKDKSFTATYTITPKTLTGSVVVNQLSHPYTGSEVMLGAGEYSVYDGANLLTENTDYTVSYSNNVNAGSGATITATGTGNYIGSITGTFTIDPMSINASGITVDTIADQPYTGAALTPTVTVRYNGTAINPSNYNLSYANNTNVGTATITITGKGNYTGSKTVNFRISPKSLEGLTYSVGGLPCTGSGATLTAEYSGAYTGVEVKPSLAIYEDGSLVSSTDYTVKYANNINIGTAKITVFGKNAYSGSVVSIYYQITPRSMDNVTVTQNGTEKRDGKIYPKVTVTDPTASYGARDLIEGTHYTITTDATTAGPGRTATITGIGNYEGTKTVTYDVGDSIDTYGEIHLFLPNGTELTPDTSGNYTFAYIGNNRPVEQIYDTRGGVITTDTRENYDITYTPITGSDYNAGSIIKVTITAKGDKYYGSKTFQYSITTKPISELTITDGNTSKTSDWTYSYDSLSKTVTPSIVYEVSGDKSINLTQSSDTQTRDFDVSAKSVGPAVTDGTDVTFTGRGNYSGTVTKSYKINKRNMSDGISIDPIEDQQYTGAGRTPEVTVRMTLSDGSTILVSKDSGYIVSYSDNVDVGQATVTVTGSNNYTGTKTANFNIIQRTLTGATITGISDSIYDGTKKTPTFNVSYNDTILTKDVDYTVSYLNNDKLGKGTDSSSSDGPVIVITGIGKYTGTVYKGFAIRGNIGDANIFEIDGLPTERDIVDGSIEIPPYLIKYDYQGTPTTVDPSYYTLIQPSTLIPGAATLTINGTGDVMYGSRSYPIVLRGSLSDVTIENIKDTYDYTGGEIKPVPLVKYNGKTLTKGTDYELVYSDDTTSVGSASITIKPGTNGFYTGQTSKDYSIKYNLNNATVSGYESSYEYTGTQITPGDLEVRVAGHELTKDSDYKLTFGNNTNVSEGGTIVIEPYDGSSITTGSKTVSFRITPVSITNANAKFDPQTFAYTGQSQKPVPEVTYNAVALTVGTDYTIEYPSDTTNVGDKEVVIKGRGNYKDSITGTKYYIGKVSLKNAAINITVNDAYYAGGEVVSPTYTVTFNGIPLIKDTDYKVYISEEPRQVRTGYGITFEGINNFEETVPTEFAVREADISRGIVTLSDTSSEYTGSAITPRIVATIDKGDGTTYKLIENTDYTVSYNGGADMIDAGEYSILITGKGGFINSMSAKYTVTPKDLSDSSKVTITYDTDNDYNDGAEVRPAPKVWDKARGVQLVEGTDYTVTYENNTAAASKDDPIAPPTITVVGQGNYTGTFSGTFNIGHPLEGLTIALAQRYFPYDGQVHKPTASVKKGNVPLTEGVDYSVTYINEGGAEVDKNVGTKYAIITALGGYYGSKQIDYNIGKKTVQDASKIRIEPNLPKDSDGNYYETFTGEEITPSVIVYDDEISTTEPMDTSDYTIEYTDNINMSTASNPAVIHAHLRGNYNIGADAYTQSFVIKAKTIEDGFQAFLPDGDSYSYTGSLIEPKVKVSPTSLDVIEDDLVEDRDYTLDYMNEDGTTLDEKAGKKKIVVTGINNYSGTQELTYYVTASLNSATIIAPDQFYTGEEVHAPLTITCGGNTLVEGVDYSVLYNSDDNWQNTGKAIITPLVPYYADEATATYNIIFDPTLLRVIGYANEYAYTGGPIKPNFKVVTGSGEEISYNPEDIVYYNSSTGTGDCTSIGTVTATIPLNIGSKTCEVTAEYDIIGRNINLCNIVPLYDNVYTGNKLYPPVLIRNEQGELLTEGVDYTLTYSDNIYPGVGKVVITGKGNYMASVTKYFNIIAPNMLGLSAAPEGDNAVKLSWLRNARITGYEIYSGDCSVKYGSTSDTTFTVTGLKQATDYEFKVRTFIKANGKTSYGEFKSVVGHTGMSAPKITGQSLARKRATINWTGATNVTGYEIYRGTSANGTFSKIAVMPRSAGGYSDSNLVSGGTYYYKVRAYEKVGENQFVYGYFSEPIAITIR